MKDIENQSGSIVKHIFKSYIFKQEKEEPQLSQELQIYNQLMSPKAELLTLQNIETIPYD